MMSSADRNFTSSYPVWMPLFLIDYCVQSFFLEEKSSTFSLSSMMLSVFHRRHLSWWSNSKSRQQSLFGLKKCIQNSRGRKSLRFRKPHLTCEEGLRSCSVHSGCLSISRHGSFCPGCRSSTLQWHPRDQEDIAVKGQPQFITLKDSSWASLDSLKLACLLCEALSLIALWNHIPGEGGVYPDFHCVWVDM